jgi:hypothetical protein
MFALLPILGGVLLGWLASRRVALAGEVVLVGVAAVAMISSAPDHGHSYASTWWVVPVLSVLGAGALLVGFRVAARRVPTP